MKNLRGPAFTKYDNPTKLTRKQSHGTRENTEAHEVEVNKFSLLQSASARQLLDSKNQKQGTIFDQVRCLSINYSEHIESTASLNYALTKQVSPQYIKMTIEEIERVRELNQSLEFDDLVLCHIDQQIGNSQNII